MQVVAQRSGVLVTHALGSCVGLTLFDPLAGVAGMLHFALPSPNRGSRSQENLGPHAFATTAVPELFRSVYAYGAAKSRLVVCVAGGAEMLQAGSAMRIGARNWSTLRELLRRNNVAIAAFDVAGTVSRNLSLDLKDGTVLVTKEGVATTLWSPAG